MIGSKPKNFINLTAIMAMGKERRRMMTTMQKVTPTMRRITMVTKRKTRKLMKEPRLPNRQSKNQRPASSVKSEFSRSASLGWRLEKSLLANSQPVTRAR